MKFNYLKATSYPSDTPDWRSWQAGKLPANSGFTLVEALVAIAVFAIASVIISSIFINVNNLQQNTASFQRLQNDGRYIVEKLAREIRGRELILPDPFTQNPLSQLAFKKDENGDFVYVCFDEGAKALKYYITRDSSEGEADCLAHGANLNADDVLVEKAVFYISPTAEDSWGQEPKENLQPRVTILLVLKNSASINIKYQKELTFQTTISSKVYKR